MLATKNHSTGTTVLAALDHASLASRDRRPVSAVSTVASNHQTDVLPNSANPLLSGKRSGYREGVMTVGVDAMGWANRRGYGRFTRNAVGRLLELDCETKYAFYVDAATASDTRLPPRAELRVVRLKRKPLSAASANSSRPIGDLLRLTAAVRKDRPDAFLFPSLQTYFPVVGTPTVVGLHDTMAEELPRLTIGSRRANALWSAKQAFAIRRAARLFTVSEASRQALAMQLGLQADRVALVPEAPDPVFTVRSSEEVAQARDLVGLNPRELYLLYSGGISPHKDVETLIRAFAATGHGRLVLVGDLEAETYLSAAGSVRAAIRASGVGDDVLLPGYVEDETLARLYTGAAAVVIPSLAEGFGLPAVEAAACGSPLVLSDLPAHRETLDGAALFFPPGDEHALTLRLRQVIADPHDLGERARRAVEGRTWDAAAQCLWDLIDDVATRRPKGTK